MCVYAEDMLLATDGQHVVGGWLCCHLQGVRNEFLLLNISALQVPYSAGDGLRVDTLVDGARSSAACYAESLPVLS